MVRLVQTMDLSYTDTNTISKRTITRFYMTHIKPCPYLESRLALFPNGPKRDSIWASSPRSTIHCVQNDFWGYGTFGANRAPILHWNLHCLQTDRNKILHNPRHLGVPSGASKSVSEAMVHLVQTENLSCTDTNTISKWTKRRFYMTHIN
jgi:hypothetical protein